LAPQSKRVPHNAFVGWRGICDSLPRHRAVLDVSWGVPRDGVTRADGEVRMASRRRAFPRTCLVPVASGPVAAGLCLTAHSAASAALLGLFGAQETVSTTAQATAPPDGPNICPPTTKGRPGLYFGHAGYRLKREE